jgi:hypothetical protein
VAKSIFDSNKQLDEVHLCANGQGWTDAEKAAAYAAKFEDDNVYTFKRSDFEVKKVPPIKVAEGKELENAAAEKTALSEETADEDIENAAAEKTAPSEETAPGIEILKTRYKKLTGKEAPGNIKVETLKAKISAIENKTIKD